MSDGWGQDRALLRKASQLLQDAGLPVKDGKRRLPNGERVQDRISPMTNRRFEPHHGPYIKNLAVLGIEATFRLVDAVQYRARAGGFRLRHDHGANLAVGDAGGQHAAVLLLSSRRHQGSYNLAGIKNPVDGRADREDRCRRTRAKR